MIAKIIAALGVSDLPKHWDTHAPQYYTIKSDVAEFVMAQSSQGYLVIRVAPLACVLVKSPDNVDAVRHLKDLNWPQTHESDTQDSNSGEKIQSDIVASGVLSTASSFTQSQHISAGANPNSIPRFEDEHRILERPIVVRADGPAATGSYGDTDLWPTGRDPLLGPNIQGPFGSSGGMHPAPFPMRGPPPHIRGDPPYPGAPSPEDPYSRSSGPSGLGNHHGFLPSENSGGRFGGGFP